MRISPYKFLALLLVGLLVGCSSAPKTKDASTAKQAVADADEQVLKSDPVERNYDPHVIMKRAEAFFEKEDYAEAAVEYQHFLDLHKSHMLAPYAQYRLGLSHFKQVTTRDRDPEHVRQYIDAMQKLLKDFPGSAYELDAKAKIKEGRTHTAEYELYVGQHYYRQAAYLAALHRFERILTLYPDSDITPEALYYLAKTYKDIGSPGRAVESLNVLLTQYPKSKVRKEGQALMTSINGKSFKNVTVATNETTAPSKSTIPPALPTAPKTRSLTGKPADLPPAGANGNNPQVVTCSLNVSC